MSDNRILQLKESDLYPMAQEYLVRYSRLDLDNEKHKRMMVEAEKARNLGVCGIEIRAVVSHWEGSCLQGGKLKKDGVEIECKAFSQIPAGAIRRIYAFVLTAGECLSDDNDPIMTRLFADTWGTAYVDAARLTLQNAFLADMKSNFAGEELFLSTYFGPGFYGMPMTETIHLNEILAAQSIGIHTKENGLMLPVKSCCGIYLATADIKSLPRQSCEQCKGNIKGCVYCLSAGISGNE